MTYLSGVKIFFFLTVSGRLAFAKKTPVYVGPAGGMCISFALGVLCLEFWLVTNVWYYRERNSLEYTSVNLSTYHTINYRHEVKLHPKEPF